MPTISLTDPVGHTLADAGIIATNNGNLRTLLNGGLDSANLKGAPALVSGEIPVWNGTTFVRSTTTPVGATSLGTGTPDSTKFLRGDGSWQVPGSSGIPTGGVIQFGAAAAPAGWVLCDGTSYLRADGTHDALFAVIGTLYGSVDGTHYNVPDFRGRFPAGFAASGGHTDVSTLGNSDPTAVANRRPKHKHTVTDPGHTHNVASGTVGSGGTQPTAERVSTNQNIPTASATTGITVGTSTDNADAAPYVVVNYIIKL